MLTGFDYRITGIGWAEMMLAGDDKEVVVTISYSGDPLPELLNALIRLRKNESVFEHITFDAENTHADLLLTNIDGLLRIEVIEDAYFYMMKPDTDNLCPMPVFTTYTHTIILQQMVVTCLQKMLATMGAGNYLEKWASAPFPEAELNQLAALK